MSTQAHPGKDDQINPSHGHRWEGHIEAEHRDLPLNRSIYEERREVVICMPFYTLTRDRYHVSLILHNQEQNLRAASCMN